MEETNANVNNRATLATAEVDADTLVSSSSKSYSGGECSANSWIDFLSDTTDLTLTKDTPDPFLIGFLACLW